MAAGRHLVGRGTIRRARGGTPDLGGRVRDGVPRRRRPLFELGTLPPEVLTLRVPRSVMDRVRQHFEAGYPNEACGALIGRADGADHAVEEFRGMRNTITDRPWDRYALDPLEQLRVQKVAASGRREIVGFG